jgi:uncharacterized protein YqeY
MEEPMSLLSTIKADALTARKARQHKTAATLTTLIGELETQAKNTGHEPTDAEVVAAVKKTVKNIDESLKVLAGRADDRELDLEYEKHVLLRYLPQQLDEAALGALIDQLVQNGAKSVGEIMKLLKERAGGQYDGAMASTLVKARF